MTYYCVVDIGLLLPSYIMQHTSVANKIYDCRFAIIIQSMVLNLHFAEHYSNFKQSVCSFILSHLQPQVALYFFEDSNGYKFIRRCPRYSIS